MSIVATRPPRDGLVRALPTLNLRAAEAVDPDGDGDVDAGALGVLEGHFLRFNQWTRIYSYYEGEFMESIAPGAIRKTLGEGGQKCLFQHGMDFQVGDKPLGPFATLVEDSEGGFYSVPLLDTSYNRDLAPGLDAGLYGASFCFGVLREEWNEDPGVSSYNPRGLPERILLEIAVIELGPVTFPAYDGASAELASAGMRSMTDDYLAARFRHDPDGIEQALENAINPAAFAELLSSRGVRSVPRVPLTRSEDAETAEEPAADAEPQADPEEPATAPEDAAEGEPTDLPSAEEADEDPSEEEGEPADAGDVTDPEAEEAADDGDAGEQPDAGDRSSKPPAGPSRAKKPAPAAPAVDKGVTDMRTSAEVEARQEEIRSRLVEIDEQHADAELPEAIQTEYDTLEAERSTNEETLSSIRARQEHVRTLAVDPANSESGDGAAPFRRAPEKEATYDISAIMSRARGAASEEGRIGILRDAALRAVDGERQFYRAGADTDASKQFMEGLLRQEANPMIDEFANRSRIAERMLLTGGETYQRAFAKMLGGAPISSEEQRALATFTGSLGGFAVPYQLDPTLIKTSNSSVNPFRAIARVETLVNTNEWKGVSSGAITAAYAAEAAEATDNSPTLAQPTCIPERAQAFVPFSYEVEQDWTAMLTELAGLIGEAKDDLEAKKFWEGAGHGSNEPEGLQTGATKTVAAGGSASFAVKDLYNLEAGLPPRFRPMAQYVANRAILNLIRQFDTAGGAALWVWLREGLGNNVATPGNIEAKLQGYPVNELSSMVEALTTGNKIMVFGNFNYFLIADRVGMNVELIQNLFGASQRPTGQRGIFALWRNSSKVLSAEAFRVLKTA